MDTSTTYQLKHGIVTTDRRLDRIPEFDPKSRAYPIRSLLTAGIGYVPIRSYTWRLGQPNLDQGTEGACVGFSWAQEFAARPVVVHGIDANAARTIYRAAQLVDEWPGEDYEGTSVLAGAKAASNARYLTEYRWAFSLEDLVGALGYHGPAVLGIDWHTDMFDPDADGLLHVSGGVAGGHAILANGVSLSRRLVRLENSWGPDWGVDGHAYVSFDDLRALLAAQGEACVPVHRVRPVLARKTAAVLGAAPPPGPGLEIQIAAAVKRISQRRLADITGISYFRLGRILRDEAGRPTKVEIDALWAAVRAEPRR